MIEEKRIVKITALLLMISLLTKGLQVIFFPLIANFFGTSKELESFIVAYSIPTFLCIAFFSNFRTTFIPLFTQQRLQRGDDAAWAFASSMINIILLGTITLVLLGLCLSPWMIQLIVPGMEPAYQSLGVRLTQILFMTVIFFALIMMFSSILQSFQSFIIPAVVLLISNLILIGMIWTLRQRIGVFVLAMAIIASQGCTVGLLLAASRKFWQNRYTYKIQAGFPLIKDALLMFIGVSIIGSFWQLSLIANRFFASYLPQGGIATLEYASRAVQLIIEVFSLSLVLPIYQRMSSESAMGELDKVRESFSLGLKIIAVVVFPLTTFVVLLRMPLFQLFLEHGKFTSQNTLHVSSVFLYLSMAIVGLGFGQMIVCAYCVLKKVKLLLGLSLCGLLLNILLGALLHREMGVEGLALASGASILLTSIFSLGALHKEIGGLNTLYLTRFTAKTLAAALVSGISVWGLLPLMSFWTGKNFLGQVAMIGLSAGIFCMIYILLMSLFKVGEINFILRLIKERMKLISQAQLSKP